MTSLNKQLPSDEELNVPHEISLSSPAMNAAATRMHQYCEHECKEFMLCRDESRDPRACLSESKAVTACGVRFLQKVKTSCMPEFNSLASCIDHAPGGRMQSSKCGSVRADWNSCISRSFGMPQQPVGYFARPHVHQTQRPEPVSLERNYQQEADQLVQHLPPDQMANASPDTRNYGEHAQLDWARNL